MPEKYYQDNLYPLQDKVLKKIQDAESDFYLTGGTALSRCYLKHRYSDDLDLFVNDQSNFKEQCELTISILKKSYCELTITTASPSFVRLMLEDKKITLKVDFVNDIPFHYGNITKHNIYHRVDNWRNILSNKICALSRHDPKDLIDIIFIAEKYEFDWVEIIRDAKNKDLWVEPLEVSKLISNFPRKLIESIKWIKNKDQHKIASMIEILHSDIFYGKKNSLQIK